MSTETVLACPECEGTEFYYKPDHLQIREIHLDEDSLTKHNHKVIRDIGCDGQIGDYQCTTDSCGRKLSEDDMIKIERQQNTIISSIKNQLPI